MPQTVPNQRVVTIHRQPARRNFLGINNDTWQAAARDLGAQALLLYLYFASNADNFLLALSPAAIRNAIGMPQSTYRDQFDKLMQKGYIVHGNGNRYDFYEIPNSDTLSVANRTETALSETRENIEINNTNIKNKYNSKFVF